MKTKFLYKKIKHKKLIFLCLCIAIIIIVGYSLWYTANPAKTLSEVMVQFAKNQGLVQMKEYNGFADMENANPFYMRIYRGTGSIDDIERKYKLALQQAGYKVEDAHYTYDPNCSASSGGSNCPEDSPRGEATNGGQPYWVIQGKNAAGDTFDSELTTITYFDSTNTPDFGEHPVPLGSFVITSDFRVPGIK